MASLTVRNIPEDAKLRFRQIAAAHGRSMEEHLRQLVLNAGTTETPVYGVLNDVTHNFKHFDPAIFGRKPQSRLRIERLIELGRGIDWEPEPRKAEKLREIDFG